MRLGFVLPLIFGALCAGCFRAHTVMPGRSHEGPLPPDTEKQRALRPRLERHVAALAWEIGERHIGRPESLERSAAYIEGVLRGLGYEVSSQEYRAGGVPVRNIEAEIPGRVPGEIVIVGAHYDTVEGTPGADDNASGVAGLLELARLLRDLEPARTLRFVAFVNEEPPLFLTDKMGSRVYARRSVLRGENIVAMLSLEMIGYYSDEKHSQRYPAAVRSRYPTTGNFVAFVANEASKDLLESCVASFRESARFPSEGGTFPEWVPGVGWSDHKPFWERGYPALMVTDTARFRHPHYHSFRDSIDQLDFERMSRVVSGLEGVVRSLAE